MSERVTRRAVVGGVLGAALACPPSSSAQLLETLAPAAMVEDLSVIERAWKALHPGLHRYQTPAALKARLTRLRRWARVPRPHREFLREVSALAASVRCGHTFVNPANQGKLIRERYFSRPDHVPFAFRWIERRMVVTHALPGSPLQPGDVVEKIGEVRAARLLADLMPYARADGGNDAKRIALMEVRPGERYTEFDLHRGLLYPASGPLRLGVQRGRSGLTVAVEPVTPAEQAAAFSDASPKTAAFEIAEGVGILRFQTWAYYNSDFDWRGFIDSAVDTLIADGARGLIVDLRGNEGGLDVGNHLLERLIAKPAALQAERRRVRYRRAPADLVPYLDTWDESFRDWGDRAVGPAEDGFYDLKDQDGAPAAISPRGARFSKPFTVLTDAANSSATFRFAEIVKANRLAAIIGAPTGGNQRGINGGAYFFLRLPNSRVEVDLPLIGVFPEGPLRPDAGLEPDIRAPWTLEDIQQGADGALTTARAHILAGA